MRLLPLLSQLTLFVVASVFAEGNPCLDPLLIEVQNERPRTMSNRQFAQYQKLVAECEAYRLHPPVDTLAATKSNSSATIDTTVGVELSEPAQANDSVVRVPPKAKPATLGSSTPDDRRPMKKKSPPKRKRRSALPWVALGIGGTGTLLTTMVYTSITDECDGITDILASEQQCRENASKDRETLLPFLIGFVGLALVGLVSVIGSSSSQ